MRNNPQSHGLWEVSAPAAPATHPLTADATVETAIIGGGFTGLSAALHLAEAGQEPMVLEGDEVGFGGSGRNVGLANAGLWLPPDDIEKALGEAAGSRLNTLLAGAPALVFSLIEKHAIASEPVRNGTLHLAHSPAGLRDLESRCAQLSRRGAPVSLLTREETAQRTGSQAFYGALHDRRAGTIQPLAYARGLAAAAIAAGARIVTGTRVTALERTPDGWRLGANGVTVRAQKVILATNAYTGDLVPELMQSLTPIHYFQAATEPLTDNLRQTILPGREGTWDTHTVMSSYRLDAAGRLIVGSIGRLDHAASGVHTGWGLRKLHKIFPQLGDLKLQHEWYGRIGMTPDAIPRCYLPGTGLVALMGYNGRGIGPGTMFGRCLADYALSGDPAALPLPVSEPKKPPLNTAQEAFYEAGAVAWHTIDARL